MTIDESVIVFGEAWAPMVPGISSWMTPFWVISWPATMTGNVRSAIPRLTRRIEFAMEPLSFIVFSPLCDANFVLGRARTSAFLLLRGALQQRWHANLGCAFVGPPEMQLAGAKPGFHLRCGGRLQAAVLGKGDDIHLGATVGTPGESCLGPAND